MKVAHVTAARTSAVAAIASGALSPDAFAMLNRSRFIVLLLVLAASGCAGNPDAVQSSVPQRLVTYEASFNDRVPATAQVETIAQSFTWSEGPAWVGDADGYLLFTDVPENTLYRWSERDGLGTLLKPSGYDGPPDDRLREAGANGSFTEPEGTVLLADSGSRLLARIDPASRRKTTLIARHEGKRFNSPNDVVRRGDGRIFFTDPPYGLKGLHDSPARELPYSGVYRLDTDGTVHLLDRELRFPNGIGLSPDGRTLYVANSDPEHPVWMAYSLDAQGNVTAKRTFADASDLMGPGVAGLPDGLCVTRDGDVFASAPGGVVVFQADGKRLGRIETGSAVSNCAFGDDGRTLYLTAHQRVLRLRVHSVGLGFQP